jgi:hypothetical protein
VTARTRLTFLNEVGTWLRRSSMREAADEVDNAIREIADHREKPRVTGAEARQALRWARDLGVMDPPVAHEERSKAEEKAAVARFTDIAEKDPA